MDPGLSWENGNRTGFSRARAWSARRCWSETSGRLFRPAPISWSGQMICRYPLRSVAFRAVDLTCASGSGRMTAHGSVRVEFESTRAWVQLGFAETGNTGSNLQRDSHASDSSIGRLHSWTSPVRLSLKGIRVFQPLVAEGLKSPPRGRLARACHHPVMRSEPQDPATPVRAARATASQATYQRPCREETPPVGPLYIASPRWPW